MNKSLKFTTLCQLVRNILRPGILFSGLILLFLLFSCKSGNTYYSYGDLKNVRKTDIHLHVNSLDARYMELAEEYNFRVMSPNVDSRIPVEEQLETSTLIKKSWPGQYAFFGTFSFDDFGKDDFVEKTIVTIDKCIEQGATGIKIWKNIGMVLRDSSGRYIMVDDPALKPVFSYLEEKKIPVMGHLGEPKNCWLPLEQMTDTGNYRYYKANPQYHMYLHPEAPSYDDQINARDMLLRNHPGLDFIAAHLASLEWSVDEIAKRLDMFPDMKIDMSARMAHLQYQSIRDFEKVRDFMIKYQDRLIYGTDITISKDEQNPEARMKALSDRWESNWIYLATDSVQKIRNIEGDVKGLHLTKKIIDKIYYENAGRYFGHI